MRSSLAVLLGLAWLAAIGVGAAHVLAYENAPGKLGAGIAHNPISGANPDDRRHTLLAALHPECPCSRATVEAIDRLAAARPGQIAVHAVFLDTAPGGGSPERSELWKRIARMPGASVRVDSTGDWCGNSAFKTSGEVCLFSPEGKLQFHGGITMSRGHDGPSAGYATILAAIDGKMVTSSKHPVAAAPVFGCAFEDSRGISSARR